MLNILDITDSATLLISDLSKINKWALQWKISFNLSPTKQAQEIIFNDKNSRRNHTGLMFNNDIVNLNSFVRYILDSKLKPPGQGLEKLPSNGFL